MAPLSYSQDYHMKHSQDCGAVQHLLSSRWSCCPASNTYLSITNVPQTVMEDTIPESSLKQELESIVRNGIAAINSRDSDPNSSAWKHFAPNCQNLGDLRNNTLAWTSDPDHEEQVRSQQPHDLLDLIQGLKRANSEYQIEIIDCTCTNINEAAGYATVCVDAEGRGIPPGLVRRVAIWFEFRKMCKENEWKCCVVETFPGMGT